MEESFPNFIKDIYFKKSTAMITFSDEIFNIFSLGWKRQECHYYHFY